MTAEQQLEALRKAARLSWIPMGMLVLTLVFVAAGLLTKYSAFFVPAAFSGLAAIASRETAPHWRNAIRALSEGTKSKGTVFIEVSEYDDYPEYRAIVHGMTGIWSFQFSPQNWMPKEGNFEAQLFHVAGVEWPALLTTPEGILFPAFEPKKSE